MRIANPYYLDPNAINAGFGNLSRALFGDPLQAGQAAFQQAQIDLDRARTEQVATETQTLRNRAAAPGQLQSQLADLLSGPLPEQPRPSPGFVGPMPPVSRQQQIMSGLPQLAGSLATMDPGSISQLGRLIATLAAASGAPDDTIIRLNAGQGQYIGQNDAASLAGQDRIRAGNFGQETKLEGMRQGGESGRNAARIAAEERIAAASLAAENERYANAPLNTPAGTITTLAPGDKRAPSGTIQGQPTESTTLGALMGDYAAGKPMTPGGKALVEGKGGIAKQSQKREISFKDQADIDSEINAQMGISFSKDGKLVDGSQPDLPPDLRAVVRMDAADFYQNGDDPATAVHKAIQKRVSVGTSPQTGVWPFHGGGETTYTPAEAPPSSAAPQAGGVDFGTQGRADAIRQRYKRGEITRDDALKQLHDLGFAQ